MENIEAATSVVNAPAASGLGAVTVMATYTTIGLAMYGAITIGKKGAQWISRRYHEHKLNKMGKATAAENN